MTITSSRPDCRLTYQLGKTRVHLLQKEKTKCWYSRTNNLQVWFWFMVSNANFQQYLLLYHGGQFYWWRKSEDPSEVTVKLYLIMLFRVHLGVRTKKCTIGKLKSEGYQIRIPIFYLHVQDRSFWISSMFNF